MRHTVYVARNATYNIDGLTTVHDADFLSDPLFKEAYALGKQTGSWGLSELPWRVYIACWAARHALRLEGDFVECGVNRGGMSRAITHYTNFSRDKRSFYLLDTFSGFPESVKHAAAESNLNDYSDCYDDVVRTFSGFSNVVLIRGEIPRTLPQVASNRVAYI